MADTAGSVVGTSTALCRLAGPCCGCNTLCAIVHARVQDTACFCLAARPSYGCTVSLRLFPGPWSGFESVCRCPIESASSGWTEVMIFSMSCLAFRPHPRTDCCQGSDNSPAHNVRTQLISKAPPVQSQNDQMLSATVPHKLARNCNYTRASLQCNRSAVAQSCPSTNQATFMCCNSLCCLRWYPSM
jgi:hypothetical protein